VHAEAMFDKDRVVAAEANTDLFNSFGAQVRDDGPTFPFIPNSSVGRDSAEAGGHRTYVSNSIKVAEAPFTSD